MLSQRATCVAPSSVGLNFSCHTEDNSPKYRMIGKIISALRSFATAQDDVQRNETVIAIMTYKKRHHRLIP